MKIHVHVFIWTYTFLGKYLGVVWLGPMVGVCLTFSEIAKLSVTAVEPSYVPTTVHESPRSSTSRQHLHGQSLHRRRSSCVWWRLIVDLTCVSLITDCAERPSGAYLPPAYLPW